METNGLPWPIGVLGPPTMDARPLKSFLAYYSFQTISRGFLRQTLFNGQILFYKDFYDFFRFKHKSPVVIAFPSFAMDLREVNLCPTAYL